MRDVTNPRACREVCDDEDDWEALRTHDANEIWALEASAADEAVDDAEDQSSV